MLFQGAHCLQMVEKPHNLLGVVVVCGPVKGALSHDAQWSYTSYLVQQTLQQWQLKVLQTSEPTVQLLSSILTSAKLVFLCAPLCHIMVVLPV